jgi:hypothetical protein
MARSPRNSLLCFEEAPQPPTTMLASIDGTKSWSSTALWPTLVLSVHFACAPNIAAKPADAPAQPVSTLVHDVRCVLALSDPRVSAPMPCPEEAARAFGKMLMASETGSSTIEGKPDVFAFGARRASLTFVEQMLAERARDPNATEARELLHNEKLTLQREQGLPFSSVAMLRVLLEAYAPSRDRDAALLRRLGEIEDALEGSAMDALDAWALEDQLTGLESDPSMVQTVTSLRLALRSFDTRAASGARPDSTLGYALSEQTRAVYGEQRRVLQREATRDPKAAEAHDVLTLALWADAIARDRARARTIATELALWSNVDERERLLRRTAADPVPFLQRAAALMKLRNLARTTEDVQEPRPTK